MGRGLLLALSMAAITLFEFFLFPGHSYLRGDSQIFVSMLERLAAPAFLSRDFVATSPHLVFTAYDEITLLLRRLLHSDLQGVLTLQQLLCRGAAVLGVYLLAKSAGLKKLPALVVSFITNLGVVLPAAGIATTELEPIPHAFAFELCLLALGLLATEKWLLAGFAGGVALLYHPPMAAILWTAIAVSFVLDRKQRPLLRPALTVLVVFLLLLANLAQLQPASIDTQALFSRISRNWFSIQRERTPEVLVSTWTGKAVLFYLCVFLGGVIASTRFLLDLSRQLRWLGTLMIFGGLLSLPLSGFLLEVCRWSLIPQLQPARALLFTIALTLAAACTAAFHALARTRRLEAAVWATFALALCLGTQANTILRARPALQPSIHELAAWAEQNTWGGSMFGFPDAGHEDYPGVFRAESIRAVYVDWTGGELSKYFERFAREWEIRWANTMAGRFSPQRLERWLDLPIDYFVLRRENALAQVHPAFMTNDFIVYERHELRNATSPLRLVSRNVR